MFTRQKAVPRLPPRSWMTIQRPGGKTGSYPENVQNISGLYFADHRLMPHGGHP